jgi:hypothetical protein
MTCRDFQNGLPEFMEGNQSKEACQHLEECSQCSDLVEDLRYIADAAKLLLPMHEPSPTVWEGIERSIHKTPKLRTARGPARG